MAEYAYVPFENIAYLPEDLKLQFPSFRSLLKAPEILSKNLHSKPGAHNQAKSCLNFDLETDLQLVKSAKIRQLALVSSLVLSKQCLMIDKARDCRDILYPGVFGPQKMRKLGCRQKKVAARALRTEAAKEISQHDDIFLCKYVDSSLSNQLHQSDNELWTLLGKRNYVKDFKCEFEEQLIQKLNDFYVTEMNKYQNSMKVSNLTHDQKAEADLARLRHISALKAENIKDYQIDDFYLDSSKNPWKNRQPELEKKRQAQNAAIRHEYCPSIDWSNLNKRKESNQIDQIQIELNHQSKIVPYTNLIESMAQEVAVENSLSGVIDVRKISSNEQENSLDFEFGNSSRIQRPRLRSLDHEDSRKSYFNTISSPSIVLRFNESTGRISDIENLTCSNELAFSDPDRLSDELQAKSEIAQLYNSSKNGQTILNNPEPDSLRSPSDDFLQEQGRNLLEKQTQHSENEKQYQIFPKSTSLITIR